MRLPLGFEIGWAWTHCNGVSSRTSAVVFSRHPRGSITWTLAVYVNTRRAQMKSWFCERYKMNSSGTWSFGTPIGGMSVSWQDFMPWPTPAECKQRDDELEAFYSPVPDHMPDEWTP